MSYILPNEMVEWDLYIVLYPFLTGVVAGAFIVSSLYQLFGFQKFRRLSSLALIISIAFMITAPLPLVAHLLQPSRAPEIFFTPNPTSPMSIFGYLWLSYLILMLVEGLFMHRTYIVRKAQETSGWTRAFYHLMALSRDTSEEAAKRDLKVVKLLALIGLPMAAVFHGYVGFIFGSLKANAWWSTPQMSEIFLLSAIVSGVALVFLSYVVIAGATKTEIDRDLLSYGGKVLGWFLLLDATVELVEVLYRAYFQAEDWGAVAQVFFGQLLVPYVGIQYLLGAAVPLAILVFRKARRSSLGMAVACALALMGTFFMRYNTIIGGQLISRTGEGFLTFSFPIFGQGSLFVMLSTFGLPLFIVTFLTSVVPWEAKDTEVL